MTLTGHRGLRGSLYDLRQRAKQPPSVRTVGFVVLTSVFITLFHFTDNYVSINTYPQPEEVTRPSVVVTWLLFTATGAAAYLLYRRERFTGAHVSLMVYCAAGFSSLTHFLYGSPDEFTTRGLVAVLIDGVAGSAVLAVAIWSIAARWGRRSRARSGGKAATHLAGRDSA